MIKYKLICKNCNLSFDSWFASSEEYEKLIKKKFLNCHNCNSSKVENQDTEIDLGIDSVLTNFYFTN